ncbi:transcriptional regulator GlxA family with amidase domain [Kibdelosporangium phytohabitans]|nr:transcriptional regulator GlxA family with amidase domain [Kibdelosporangium phytohabitans]
MTALDAIGPYELLRSMPDAEVRFVAAEPGPIVTDSGVLILHASHSFDETPTPDIVLVPGGSTGTVGAMNDQKLLDWLRAAHPATTCTTSVCSGALILAAAGLLKDVPATTHWVCQDVLGSMGAIPQRDKRIVVSGKIATAAGVSAGIDLALWLIGEIHGREQAELSQLVIEYDPRPPYDAGHPSKVTPEFLASAKTRMLAQAQAAG